MTAMEQRYQRAEQLLSQNLSPKLKNLSLLPNWLDGHRFWFKRDLENGYEFILVDSEDLTQVPIFDHRRLASVLSELFGQPFSSCQLPIETLEFDTDNRLRLVIDKRVSKNRHVLLALKNYECVLETDKGPITVDPDVIPLISPDGQREVVCRDHNLVLRERVTGVEKALTQDGQPHYGYGNYADYISVGTCEGMALPPAAQWSPDGRYLAVERTDERHVKEMPLIQTVPIDGSFRPINHPYKLALPGDSEMALASLCVIDLHNLNIIACDRPPVSSSGGGFFSSRLVSWGADNELYFVEWTHDKRTVRLVAFDPESGTSNVLVEEKGQGYLHPGPFPFEPAVFNVLPELNEFIWYSHRSGWGHLYRYDLITGELKNAITSGDFVIKEIHQVDTDRGIVYFTACGRELDRNPYFEHFYRVNLDGSDLVLLTPEASQHDIIHQTFET